MDRSMELKKIAELKKSLAEKQQQKNDLQNHIIFLKAEFDLLQKIVRLLPGNIYWKNRQGKYLGCNNNTASSVGLRYPEDIVGKLLHEFIDAKYADNLAAIDEQVMSKNMETIHEELGPNKDGKKSVYITHKIPLRNENQEVEGLLGVSIDITQQKVLEEELKKTKKDLEKTNQSRQDFINQMRHLQELIAILPGNVYWKSRDGTYLGCNENMLKILGLKTTNEIVGKTVYDLIPYDIAKAIHEADEEIMALNQTISLEENAFDQEKQPAVYITKKTPIHDEQGHVIGLIGVSVDITARAKAEEALKIAKQKAEEASKIKIDFIRNMEHDIRTPFNGIYGIANILYDKEADEFKKEYLKHIVNSTQELLEYCDTIIDFSRIETGIVDKIQKQFSLRRIIEKVITAEKLAFIHKGIKFNFNYDENIPAEFIGDDYRLYRILINLVSNAIKFTPQGYIAMQTKLIKKNNKQAVVKIIVEDTGIGIPEDKIAFIYEKFSRLNPSNQNKYKGLGLGLKIVKQFVEEMEGTIEVSSEPGKGSQFICQLPFRLVKH